ncbi:MAG: PadR family transcriptional regulator [Sphingobium sp.]|uniref:PadR family transcriptional regulator n=1 Tax=Sphingobium sp. TaxID=1912891 RepID=UPI0029ADE051|nr:PadR family transcriptional regulator [Sphingobium sp.]MDX3910591.1 PadR family transcriptional regulator [Sphingobium sp.]
MASRRTSATLEMLLLSLLANGDTLSGYQISSILAEPISLMWPVKHSQIYPALATLEERGDILGDWVVQNARPNKKAYGITPSGTERLKAWLLEARTTLSQDEIRLIAYNLDLLGDAAVAAAMAKYRLQCVEEKRQLEERWPGVWQSPWSDHADQARMVGIRSIYEHALAIREAQILWCDEGIERARLAIGRTQPPAK